MERGKLSYSKARAITRVASAENEDVLLEYAQYSTAAQLEKICSHYRGVLDANEKSPLDHRIEEDARYVRHRQVKCGMVKIEALLHADEADLVIRAIEAARFRAQPETVAAPSNVSAETFSAEGEELDEYQRQSIELDRAMQQSELDEEREDVSAEISSSGFAEEMRRAAGSKADALLVLAESFLAHGPKERKGGERVQMVVHVDAEVLAKRATEGRCATEDATPLSLDTVRRLCCDASIYAVAEDAKGNVLDVGRRARTIPVAIERALSAAAGRKCRFPGCTHSIFVDSHHIVHWADGGKTSLENLCDLCRRHHRLVHEEGYRVVRSEEGRFSFFHPQGWQVDEVPPVPAVDVAARANIDDLIEDADPLELTAKGDLQIDYAMAVGALAAIDQLDRRPPARAACLN
jgi:hypothetical protein